jgi:hypothetical protein
MICLFVISIKSIFIKSKFLLVNFVCVCVCVFFLFMYTRCLLLIVLDIEKVADYFVYTISISICYHRQYTIFRKRYICKKFDNCW